LNPLAKLDFARNEFRAFGARRAAHIQQKMICLIARRATQQGRAQQISPARRPRDRSGEDDQSAQDTANVSAMVITIKWLMVTSVSCFRSLSVLRLVRQPASLQTIP
jgi:hypothetical protein